jgi:hypothetical protein
MTPVLIALSDATAVLRQALGVQQQESAWIDPV